MIEINTNRLRLRAIEENDVRRIFECWASDDEVTKYLTWLPHTSVDVTKRVVDSWMDDYKDPDCRRWGIELKESGKLIGMIDVVHITDGCPVIGYVLGRNYWNRGYMTEAFCAVCSSLFAEGYETILIEADERNIGSNRVIEKNGFRFVRKETKICSCFKPDMVTVNRYRKGR